MPRFHTLKDMSSTPTDPDHATVSELIVQLAQVEDAMRHSGRDGTEEPEAALVEREQAIVAALHQRGLPFHAHSSEVP